MQILVVLRVMGLLLMLYSLCFLMPIAASLIYWDGAILDFVAGMLINLATGLLMWWPVRHHRRELRPRDAYVLVVLVWSLLAAVSAVPLMIHLPTLSFTDAFFETMSALTTTGATVLIDLDKLPASVNLWRHELQWFGGMGIIVLAVAILPMLGVGGRQLFVAETPGPMKDAKLAPRITETAKILWFVYAGITATCILALKLAGASWLDAICHAFAALSLGGFSTHDASVGFFNSPLIEAILIVFMLLAGVNFATHFLAWHRRSLRAYLQDHEFLPYLATVGLSVMGVTLYLWHAGTYPEPLTALRHVSFNLVSIATASGFASTDFNQWPIFAPLWMLLLSCIVSCAGSTGGGIKMIRTLLVFKLGMREMKRMLHPNAIWPIKFGAHAIPDSVLGSVLGFFFVYVGSIAILSLVLTASGLDFVSSFTAIIACINNAGPGLNQVGPATNYQVLTDFQTWVCTFTMLLGRLELFTLLVLFTPAFWRN